MPAQESEPEPEAEPEEDNTIHIELEKVRAERQRIEEISRRTQAEYDQLQRLQQSAAQNHLESRVAQYEQAFAQEFPEAYSAQAEQQLARDNPTRYAELHDRRAQYQRAIKADAYDAVTNHQAVAAQQQEQFNRAAQLEDQRFSEAHPELQDERTRRRAQEGIYRMFEENGVSRDQLNHLYQTNSAVRSHMGHGPSSQRWTSWIGLGP
jgi:hypothetical protein